MKLFIFFFFFSCTQTDPNSTDVIIIDKMSSIIEHQKTEIDSLKFELENCKANYEALDEASR